MASDERGTDYSIGDHYRKYRSSWVSIRLHLVFEISPPTPWILDKLGTHRKLFTRSRTHQRCQIILELYHLDIFMDIGAFLIWDPWSNHSSFNAGSPPSVPRCYQRYLGWFWSRKAGLISENSRGRYFVSWTKLVGFNIVWQRLWM